MCVCAYVCLCVRRIGLEVLGYFLGLYYFIQMLLDGTVIAGLLYTTYK